MVQYVFVNVLHPGKTEKEIGSQSPPHLWMELSCLGWSDTILLDRESVNAALCVQATQSVQSTPAVCPPSPFPKSPPQVWSRPRDRGPLLYVQASTELWAQRWTLGQPQLAGWLATPPRSLLYLPSECVNLYKWCENSSINVYQENIGRKTKKWFLFKLLL